MENNIILANAQAVGSTTFYITGGTLPLDASSYVVRHADTDLYESLAAGEFCYVLDTRQMGKSSLMVRTAVRLRQAGARVAVLDLTAIGQNLTPEQWYDGLLNRLGQQLGMEDEFEEFYRHNTRLGPLHRFMEAISRVALDRHYSRMSGDRGEWVRQFTEQAKPAPANPVAPKASRSLVIFVDEIDAVRSLPFPVDEFFAAIRECYNRRTEDPSYRNLVFCLLGVATPSDLVEDPRTSPFNVGRRIVLSDFTPEEAAPLAYGLLEQSLATGSRQSDLLVRILYWTNGHPYMTQRLCRAVAEAQALVAVGRDARSTEEPSSLVDSLAASLFFSRNARDNDDNLAFVRNRLLRSDTDVAALLDLYRLVRKGRNVRDDETSPLISILRLSGIVKVESGLLAVRNRIYAHVFDLKWIAANMPDAEVQRQRRAYRAGILRATLFGGALAAALGALAVTAIVNKQRADSSAHSARIERDNAKVSAALALASEQRAKSSEKRATDLAESERAERNRAEGFGNALGQTLQNLTREEKLSWQNLQKARSSAARASRAEAGQRQEMRRLNRVLYDATMNLVQREYEAHEYERMQELLNQTRSAEDRGFEWHFWQGLCPLQRTINTHSGEVLCVSYSPDGSRFASGGVDDSVVVCDSASGRILNRWKEDGEVRAASFSPDGKRIAVGLSGNDKPGRAVIRETDSGRALVTLPVSKSVWAVAFSHDAKRLATNGERIQLWNTSSGAAEEDYGPGGPAVAFSPGDNRICFSRWAETGKPAAVDVLDLNEGTVTFSLAGQQAAGQVRAIAWSPNAVSIATAGDDRAIRLWDARNGQPVRPLLGHGEAIISANFSPDSKRLLTSSLDDEARVWDVASPSDSPRLMPGPGVIGRNRPPLRDMRFFARENRLLFKHARNAVFSPDGRRIITGSHSGVVRLWSAVAPESYLVLDSQPVVSLDHIGAVAFSPDSRQIAAAIDSPIGTVWDAVTGTRRLELRGHNGDVSAIAFFPDSSHIVTGSRDGAVKVWTAGFPRRVTTLQGHKGPVNCVAVSADGRRIVSAGEDGVGILWDIRTQRRIGTLNLGSVAHGIAFSSDGARIAVAQTVDAGAGRVTLWDANTGRILHTVAMVQSRALAVRFSPDGSRILAGIDDKTARIWETSTGKLLQTLTGHSSGVNSVAFSSDGRRAVTGSFDTTAKLWDARTGKEILTLHHPTFVVGVALSRDHRRIVTACEDGSTRVWTADRIDPKL